MLRDQLKLAFLPSHNQVRIQQGDVAIRPLSENIGFLPIAPFPRRG
jgi:hypothetical protein